MLPFAADAQDLNKLWIPDVTATAGEQVTIPVYVRNTCNDLVGAQFELTLPNGVTLDANSGQVSSRCTDHEVLIRRNGNAWRVMVYSPSNTRIQGNAGIVVNMQATLGNNFQAEGHYPMSIDRVILSSSEGNNVITAHDCGELIIGPSADFIVRNVRSLTETLIPGETFTATWTVTNQGHARSHSGWKEEVFLLNNSGELSVLSTIYCSDSLATGASVNHSAEIMVPALPGIEGTVMLQVKLTPNLDAGEAVEYQGNNTTTGEQSLTLAKQLSLEIPEHIDEGNRTQRCRLARSGSWTAAQTFNLSITGDGRLAVPSSVTIPAGQSAVWFNITVTDDSMLNTDSIFTISASGNDYPELTQQVVVVDDEKPKLTVTASKSTVKEGENLRLTISTERASSQPITVNLTCDVSGRFTFPSQVTIPANTTSVTVDVSVLDNSVIEMTASPTFTVSSNRYTSGECIIILEDNDMPTLSLSLTPTQVSESAGSSAVIATISRTDNLDKEVVLKLSEDSGGRLSCPKTVTMAAGQQEVQFSIGTVDNSTVDGNKTVTVIAEVYAASCSCSIPPENDGTMTKTLVIVDDDGPSLTIKSSAQTLLEGSTGNVFTVSHNVASSQAVTVRVSSDKDDMLTYEHNLTIPAGSKSAQLLVDVKRNSTTGDSQLATFTVEKDGFSSASMWIVVTDQTLPDAVVSITTDATEVEAEGTLQTTVEVTNNGYQTLPASTPVNIWFSGVSYPMSLKTDKDLAPGESTALTYDYQMPAITGNYTIYATVNENHDVQELVYANNSSQRKTITLLPKFRVTAQADKDVYVHGEPVTISGQALGSAGSNATVEVYLINEGTRQKTLLRSGADGRFSVVWPLYERQSGHFVIGACYPGTGETTEMDAFDVIGIRTDAYFTTCMVDNGDTYTGKIKVTNPGNLPQNGLRIEPQATPDNVSVNFSPAQSIGAGQTVELSFSIQGNAVTSGTDWQQIPLVIKTDEGATANYTLYYYVQSLYGKLSSNTSRFSTTMTFGKPREYPITVRNIGKGDTGDITLSLPYWMSSTSSYNIPSLAKGDSTTIVLQFVPNSEMKLNVPVTGQLGVNCANGEGLAIAFDITPVSEEKGTLTVDAVDESAFFTEEKPHLAGARVTVKTPVAGTVVAQGITKADGTFSVSLPEGWYNIHVEADKHSSYDNTLIVDPGVTTNHEAFLAYQAITYSWQVEETEVEDVYEMETVVTFDTRVPKPVVVVYLPDETPEPYSVMPIVVTNEGQIDAVDLSLSLSVDEGYYFEFLNTPTLDVVKAHQSYMFYAKLMPKEEENEPQGVKSKGVVITKKCWTVIAKADYKEQCKKYVDEQMAQAVKRYGDRYCVTKVEIVSDGGGGGGGINDNATGGFGWGGGYSGGGPGSGPVIIGGFNESDSHYTIWDTENATKYCEPLYDDLKRMPDGIVPESEKCSDPPMLIYSLVTNDKNREYVKGVAADGISTVSICLEPLLSRIPSDKCNSTIRWELSKNLGKLKNPNAWNDVVYEAPDDFPMDVTTPADTISAKFTCDGEFGHIEGQLPIIVTRTPLVLLHGLASDETCWKSFKKRLLSENLYDECCIDTTGYPISNCDHFKDNERVVQNRLDFLFRQMKYERGIIAGKADVVGHSMGGILARIHTQYVTKDNIHKLITVNTPHSGSEWGDFVQWILENDKYWSKIIEFVKTFEIKGFYSTHAVHDLGVNSYATRGYLNKKVGSGSGSGSVFDEYDLSKGVPIHVIVTEDRMTENDEPDGEEGFQGYKWSEIVSILNSISPFSLYEKMFMKVFSKVAEHVVEKFDEFASQKIDGDLVVSLESQKGGLEKPYYDYVHGPWHCAAPDNKKVQDYLLNALLVPSNDGIFSLDGFKPVLRGITLPNFVPYTFDDDTYFPSNQLQQTGKTFDSQQSVSTHSLAKRANSNNAHITAHVEGNMLTASLDGVDSDKKCIVAVFENENYEMDTKGQLNCQIPSTHVGTIKLWAVYEDADGEPQEVNDQINYVPQVQNRPVRLLCSNMGMFVGDTLRTSVKCIYEDGTEEYVIPDAIREEKGYVKVSGRNIVGTKAGYETLRITYKNVSCSVPVEVFKSKDDDEESEESASICSTITLSFKQKMVMTRQAFRGTLTVNNGSGQGAMENVTLNLVVRDMDGKIATSHEFQINPESLDGFAGELDFGSGWTLASNATGTATILFIPTRYAAPTEPKDYSFGGTFSYKDPTTGLQVTRELNPVTLTVNPSPTLDLTYFLQRDIFADDPLTEEVEVSQPAEFALLINNKGYGDATNVRMTTNQPEIVDNEKGLLIDFEILSSQVNGGEAHLSFGKNAVNDFGTIAAQSQSYAQWWLRSSLLGHFTSYDVTATHLTSYGNEDLSLLDQVSIHELIHGFTVDGGRGFLVNDIPDNANMPDEVYLTDASQHDVQIASAITLTRQSKLEYMLSVSAGQPGWTYGKVADPTNGWQEVVSIVRQSDGKVIPLDNVWQTDKTLRKGKDPLYENLFHFVGEILSSTETYLITFEEKPDVVLEVSSFEGLPAEGSMSNVALTDINVVFNKPIKPESFTAEDLTLTCQGKILHTSSVTITQVSEVEYAIHLSDLTTADGYYVLTVMTPGIIDSEGFKGDKGFNASWTQINGGKVVLTYATSPGGVGSFTIETLTAEGNPNGESITVEGEGTRPVPLGNVIRLTALAAEGYTFAYWTRGGEKVSSDSIYEMVMTWNEEVVAHYEPKSYQVTIVNSDIQGKVLGAETGKYEYGTELHLSVKTYRTNRFIKWIINGTEEYDTQELTLVVKGDTEIQTEYALLGDVNFDKKLTVADVMLMVNHLIGRSFLKTLNNADMNDDNSVTVTDLMVLIRNVMRY